MQSQGSSPRGTAGGEDGPERQGAEDGRSVDKGHVSRLMSHGDADESTSPLEGDGQASTTKQARENAAVFPDPPAGSVPDIVMPLVENLAQLTSSQAQVTFVSGDKLEHLSLVEWKMQPGFQELQFDLGQFLNPAITTGEKELSTPIHDAVRASSRSSFKSVNPAHKYPAWRTERLVTRMIGVEKTTNRICRLYRDRLRKELRDMAKSAGLPEAEAHLRTILRQSAGPDRPDMVCSAYFFTDKEVWTYIEVHKKGTSHQVVPYNLTRYLSICFVQTVSC